MVLGIRGYPVDVDANELIDFIDSSIENGSLTKNMAHVSKLTFNDGKDDFLEQDNPMIKNLDGHSMMLVLDFGVWMCLTTI